MHQFIRSICIVFFFFFFFNDTATTEIYTLSLHDALPIWEANATSLGEAASISGTAEWFPNGEGFNEVAPGNGVAQLESGCAGRRLSRPALAPAWPKRDAPG